MSEMDHEMEKFKSAVDAFLRLSPEELSRHLDEASLRAKEASDRFDQACRFTDLEWRNFLHQPMTI